MGMMRKFLKHPMKNLNRQDAKSAKFSEEEETLLPLSSLASWRFQLS
jgi:hypothetical protein